MDSYVYLIRNGDLYNIGTSNNLDRSQDSLRPGELRAYLKSKNSDSICRNLYSRYSDARLPGSDYFRLSKSQQIECELMMNNEGGENYFKPIFTGRTLFKLQTTFTTDSILPNQGKNIASEPFDYR